MLLADDLIKGSTLEHVAMLIKGSTLEHVAMLCSMLCVIAKLLRSGYLGEAGLVALVHRADLLLALVERGRSRYVAQRRGIGHRAHRAGMRSHLHGRG